MSELGQIACIHRRKGEPPLSEEELAAFHPLVPSWKIIHEDKARKLRNTFTFENEEHSRRFVERVMAHAETQNHHPVIDEKGNEVSVDWWTHSINDLHPNDFIMAAKTDGAYSMVVVGAEGDMTTNETLPVLPELPRFQKVVFHRYGDPKEWEEANQ